MTIIFIIPHRKILINWVVFYKISFFRLDVVALALTFLIYRQTLTPIGQKFYRKCSVLAFDTPAMSIVHCETWNLC